MKPKSINRLLLAVMLVASVFAAGCESDEAKSWRELKEARAAREAAEATRIPDEKTPECIQQDQARKKGEITWEQMSPRCSEAFNGPRRAPGGS